MIYETIAKYLRTVPDYEDEANELSNLISRIVIERRIKEDDN